MRYEADSPEGYLAALESDWRKERVLEVRHLLLAVVPGLEEGVGYGMLEYRLNDEVFAHLNAQKYYVGVYLGDLARLDPDRHVTGSLDTGKSCVRLKKRDRADVLIPLLDRKRELRGGAC